MKKVLALYDTDAVYATRFMEYLNKRKNVDFEVIAFTKKECLKEFIVHSQLEILLLGDELSLDEFPKEKIKLIIYLDDSREQNPEVMYPRILRYQTADGVWKDIQSHYSKCISQTQSSKNRNGPLNIISVFSPLPGIAGETFSWNLALNLAERHKTLFIPLELFPVSTPPTATDSDDSLSEYIYYLKDNHPDYTEKLNALLKFYGKLSYLNGLTHGLDLLSLNKEDATRWVKDLSQNLSFNTVIFYVGFYSEFAIELLNHSTRTLVMAEDNSYGECSINEWKRQMEFMGVKIEEPLYQIIYQPEEVPQDKVCFDIQERNNNVMWQLAAQQASELYANPTL